MSYLVIEVPVLIIIYINSLVSFSLHIYIDVWYWSGRNKSFCLYAEYHVDAWAEIIHSCRNQTKKLQKEMGICLTIAAHKENSND